MRETAPIENMRQLLRLPINSFVYSIGAVSALQRSPCSSTGICIPAFFITTFFCFDNHAMQRAIGREEEKGRQGREKERKIRLINVHFLSYDPVKEDYSVSVAREYLDYIEY